MEPGVFVMIPFKIIAGRKLFFRTILYLCAKRKKMAKVLFKQYLWIITLLKDGKHMTLGEIQAAWRRSTINVDGGELSPRTFYNWRQTIETELYIEIVADGYNRYYIADLDEIGNDSTTNWLLQSIALSDAVSGSSMMKDRILLEPIPSSETYLQQIIEAMKENRLMTIQYKRFNEDGGEGRLIAPLSLKMHQRRWYVLARLEGVQPKDDDPSPFRQFGVMRVFALDRIKRLETMSETFEYPEGFSPEAYFSDFYGIYSNFDKPVERVLLAVPDYQRGWIDTLPLHHSQKEVEHHRDYSVYEYHMRVMPDFCRAILYNGLDIEVLEPQSLKYEMSIIAEELDRMYNGEYFIEE